MVEQRPQYTMILEVTVLSAQGLKNHSTFFFSLFSHRIRPFITLTYLSDGAPDDRTHVVEEHGHVSMSTVDDHGESKPRSGDKFRVPIDTTFFSNEFSSSLYLQLHTKRLFMGQAQLGWCVIYAKDIGLLPEGSVRYLSYRLRDRDGTRGHGIINLSIKLEGLSPVASEWTLRNMPPTLETCHTVVGIPVFRC